jgi:hypothetical protein
MFIKHKPGISLICFPLYEVVFKVLKIIEKIIGYSYVD